MRYYRAPSPSPRPPSRTWCLFTRSHLSSRSEGLPSRAQNPQNSPGISSANRDRGDDDGDATPNSPLQLPLSLKISPLPFLSPQAMALPTFDVPRTTLCRCHPPFKLRWSPFSSLLKRALHRRDFLFFLFVFLFFCPCRGQRQNSPPAVPLLVFFRLSTEMETQYQKRPMARPCSKRKMRSSPPSSGGCGSERYPLPPLLIGPGPARPRPCSLSAAARWTSDVGDRC